MFENLDFSKMSEMFEQVQKKATELENELANKEFTAKSGGGLVSASVNGKGELIDLNIDETLLEDRESLQILLISAINDALNMANLNRQNIAGNIFGGLQ